LKFSITSFNSSFLEKFDKISTRFDQSKYFAERLFLIAYCKWRLKLDIKAFIPLKTLAGYSLVLLSVLGLIIFF
jgi:hypothetical protein